MSSDWFMQTKGIPTPLQNSEKNECQMRNMFNALRDIPEENSCLKYPEVFQDFTSKNFGTSCGVQSIPTKNNYQENKIINGIESSKGSWPWMASLRKTYRSEHFCGGVLISNRVVVTAAHCILIGIPDYVILGDFDSQVRSPEVLKISMQHKFQIIHKVKF